MIIVPKLETKIYPQRLNDANIIFMYAHVRVYAPLVAVSSFGQSQVLVLGMLTYHLNDIFLIWLNYSLLTLVFNMDKL